MLNPDPLNRDYQLILDGIQKSQVAGTKTPFFTEQNSSIIKGYYDDGKSTY